MAKFIENSTFYEVYDLVPILVHILGRYLLPLIKP
jgi:hypothetical protein